MSDETQDFYDSAEVKEVAGTIMAMIKHVDLDIKTARVRYLFSTKKSKENSDIDDKIKISLINGVNRYLIDADYVVVVSKEQWDILTPTQKEALTYYILLHGILRQSKKGEMKWSKSKDKLSILAETVKEYGEWYVGLIKIRKAFIDHDTILGSLA